MSGGSYNYLYSKADESALDLLESYNDLTRIYSRLSQLGYATHAASATENILKYLDELSQKIEEYEKRIKPRNTGLKKVWQAVEYWDSSDCSEQEVRAAIADFEADYKLESSGRS